MNIKHASDSQAISNVEVNNPTQNKIKFDLEERLVDFAVRLIEISESLHTTSEARYGYGQIGRSGTSPALQDSEAQIEESRKAFIRKLKIVLKELRGILAELKNYQRTPIGNKMKIVDTALIERNQQYEKFHLPLSFREGVVKKRKSPLSFGEGPGVRQNSSSFIEDLDKADKSPLSFGEGLGVRSNKTKNNSPAVQTLDFKL